MGAITQLQPFCSSCFRFLLTFILPSVLHFISNFVFIYLFLSYILSCPFPFLFPRLYFRLYSSSAIIILFYSSHSYISSFFISGIIQFRTYKYSHPLPSASTCRELKWSELKSGYCWDQNTWSFTTMPLDAFITWVFMRTVNFKFVFDLNFIHQLTNTINQSSRQAYGP